MILICIDRYIMNGVAVRSWKIRFALCEFRNQVSTTLEFEADPTLENEATGSYLLVCRVLGSDAGQGVDPAVA